jgi:hypothetical protein
VFVGLETSAILLIENVGSDTLHISDISVTENAFSVDTSLIRLIPGENYNLMVRFAPLAVGEHTGYLKIISNDINSDTFEVYLSGYGEEVTGLLETTSLPKTFGISPNYPNPFNPTTLIKYQLPAKRDVKLLVYNILGQKVRILINNSIEAGYHEVEWDGRNDSGIGVSSGVYIYHFSAGNYTKIRKMILLR